MKRKIRRGLMVLLALIFAGSLGMVIYRTMEYKEGEEIRLYLPKDKLILVRR